MAQTYHMLVLVGKVTFVHGLRYTPQGTEILEFGMATYEAPRKEGENPKPTYWDISVFGKLASKALELVKVGKTVFVQGRIRSDDSGHPRTWVDQNGSPRSRFSVTADFIVIPKDNESVSTGEGADTTWLEE